jgi:hypothetical protein
MSLKNHWIRCRKNFAAVPERSDSCRGFSAQPETTPTGATKAAGFGHLPWGARNEEERL